MWAQALLALLLVLQCSAELRDDHRALSDSNTDFGLDLLHLAQNEKLGNTILSPFSISTALALTYLGADGATREEMAAGLGFDGHDEPLALFKSIIKHVTSDVSFTLRQANRVYGDSNLDVKESYLKEAKKYFDAPFKKVDFTDPQTRVDINQWVADQTEDRIKDLLQEGDLEGVVMVLINAIYFKALWEQPLTDKSLMKDRDFNLTADRSVKVEYMRSHSPYRVGKIPGVNARILELNYKGGEASMYIILPDAVDGLCEVQAALSAQRLNEAIDNLQPAKRIDLRLPKFELNYRLQLTAILKAIGMERMFTGADFSRMSDDPLAVGNVIHASFIKVDQNGTEAAAATVVTIVRTSLPLNPDVKFYVEHPFIFFIREKASGAVLFNGRVVDPTDKIKDFNDKDGHKCDINVPKLRTVSERNSAQTALPFSFGALILAASILLFYSHQ